MIVLDTNVVSELMRPLPAASVVAWFEEQDVRELRVTAVTLAELLYGIGRLPAGARRRALGAAADDLMLSFPQEILPFGHEAARCYGPVVAMRERAGAPIAVLDAQIAAICQVHGASLATRNVKDFVGTSVDLVDPWSHPL